ncbi:MAG: hypothetical protein JNK21_06435 [Rhodospirillaceae bacterium]|nr:hypothetical protein [Rhodospirillaceae bacterium]
MYLSNPMILQRLIAVPFLVLGAWCLLLPGMVETLTLRPEHQMNTTASRLFIGCFGAQAVLSGLFAFFSRFTRTTFLVYGVALLPFFWFNYYFVFAEPVFNGWLALDFGANVVMLALCVQGWRVTPPEK